MVTSFLLGAIAFTEAITNLFFGVIALPALVLGVFLILSCQQKQFSETSHHEEVIYFSSILGSECAEGNNTSDIIRRSSEVEMNVLQKSTNDNPSDDFEDNILNNSSSFLYDKVNSAFTTNNDIDLSSHSNADRDNLTLLTSQNATNLSLSHLRMKFTEWLEDESTLKTTKAVFICILAGSCTFICVILLRIIRVQCVIRTV
jgi:hypothetical protein